MASYEGVFQPQIKCMMYTFGDAKNPNPECMLLVEDFTRQQLRDMVSHAARVSSMRDGRMLRTEDVMFLLRKDKDQLRSLVRYVEMKILTKKARTSQKRFDDDYYSETDFGERSDTIGQKTLKLFDDSLTPLQKAELRLSGTDELEAQRLKHYDEFTESMDAREYIEYAEQRTSSLYKNLTKFKEWVGVEELTSLTVNNEVLDILGHLAHETVRKLVELSLQVRCDMESKTQTPRQWPLTHSSSGQEPSPLEPPSSEQGEGDNSRGVPFALGTPPSSPPANILSSPHTTDTEVTSTLRRSSRETRKRQRGAQQPPSAPEHEAPPTAPPPTKKRAPRALKTVHFREAIRRLEQSHHTSQVTPLWTHHSSSKYRKSWCL